MTTPDRVRGDLMEVLPRAAVDMREPINAVYYRNTQLAARTVCFLDFLAEPLAEGA